LIEERTNPVKQLGRHKVIKFQVRGTRKYTRRLQRPIKTERAIARVLLTGGTLKQRMRDVPMLIKTMATKRGEPGRRETAVMRR